jgi:hypothetical protein
MAHGGTNFGFYNGANTGQDEFDYKPDLTSYDYASITPNNFFRLLIFFCKLTYLHDLFTGRMHQLRSMEMCIIQNTKACCDIFQSKISHTWNEKRTFFFWCTLVSAS